MLEVQKLECVNEAHYYDFFRLRLKSVSIATTIISVTMFAMMSSVSEPSGFIPQIGIVISILATSTSVYTCLTILVILIGSQQSET